MKGESAGYVAFVNYTPTLQALYSSSIHHIQDSYWNRKEEELLLILRRMSREVHNWQKAKKQSKKDSSTDAHFTSSDSLVPVGSLNDHSLLKQNKSTSSTCMTSLLQTRRTPSQVLLHYYPLLRRWKESREK